jgi:hypothetical protein
LGVAEKVDLSIEPDDTPGASGTVWENSGGGTFDTNGGQDVTYTAWIDKESDTITPYLGDGSTLPSITFTVTEPTATIQPLLSIVYDGNDPIGVSFTTNVYMAPDTVNFSYCDAFAEGHCEAIASGYFSYCNGLEHNPGDPTSINNNVVAGDGTQVNATDNVATETLGPDTLYGYNSGDFLWPIPHSFTARGSNVQYLTQDHHAVLNVVSDPSGYAYETLSKGGASASSEDYQQ